MPNSNINNTAPFGQQCLSLAKLILRLDLRPFLLFTVIMILEDALFIYMGWTIGFLVVYTTAAVSFFTFSHMMVLGNYTKPQVTAASGSRLLVSVIIFLTELSCMALTHISIWLHFAKKMITDPDDVKYDYLILFFCFCIWYLAIVAVILFTYYFKISNYIMFYFMWMVPSSALSSINLFEYPWSDLSGLLNLLNLLIAILLYLIVCYPLYRIEHKLKK